MVNPELDCIFYLAVNDLWAFGRPLPAVLSSLWRKGGKFPLSWLSPGRKLPERHGLNRAVRRHRRFPERPPSMRAAHEEIRK